MKKKTTIKFVAALLGMLATFATAQIDTVAGAPKFIDYQGQLLKDDGTPFAERSPDGTSNSDNFVMHFSIYDDESEDATLLWREKQIVTVDHGLFSVRLGEGRKIEGDPRPEHLDSVFHGGARRYLGLTVFEDPDDTPVEIKPRLQFLAVPYASVAERAKVADGVQLGAITKDHIGPGAITTEKLALNAVTEETIADGAVGFQNLKDEAVGSQHLVDGAVGNEQIGDQSIGGHHLTSSWALWEKVDGGWQMPVGNNHTNGHLFVENMGSVSGKTVTIQNNGLATTIGGDLKIDKNLAVDGNISAKGTLTTHSTLVVGSEIVSPSIRLASTASFRSNNSVRWDLQSIPNGEFLFNKYDEDGDLIASPYITQDGRFIDRSNLSDIRLKKNITPLEGVLDKAMSLRPALWEWNGKLGCEGEGTGLVAQKLEEVFPDLVLDGPDGFKRVDYSRIGFISLAALQEMHAEVQADSVAKDAKIESLQKENLAVRKRLDRLEKLIKSLGN